MLTTSQSTVADGVIHSLVNNKIALLKGSAGVGKTYLADHIIQEYLKVKGGKIFVTAPTNKAVAVIRGKVKEDPRIKFLTTHSALQMKRHIDNLTGVATFRSVENEKYPILKGVGLLVIDESSMVNELMDDDIQFYAQKQGVAILYIGDDKQLNPVGEKYSTVFRAGYPEFELTEIIRQGEGNPIIDLSRDYYSVIRSKRSDDLDFDKPDSRNNLVDGDKGYIVSNNRPKVIKNLADVNGSDEFKYLAWTNNEVNSMNFIVRNTIYGNPAKVEKGETLIFDAPYMVDNQQLYYTNEEMRVSTLDIVVKKVYIPGQKPTDDTLEMQFYALNAGDRAKDGIMIVHESSQNKFDAAVSEVKRKAIKKMIPWRDFFAFKEQFAETKYNHAITVHKSQGSTYKNTVLNIHDVMRNRVKEEQRALLYTGITRASDLLILYNMK